jgi:recombination protein RecA
MVKKEEKPLVFKLSAAKPIEYVTSGVPEIDAVTQLPRGRVTEIYGNKGVGKTTLMSICLAAQSKEAKVLYIDTENALNPSRVQALGGDLDRIDVSTEYLFENVAEMVLESLDKYDLIVVDSVAMMISRTESENDFSAHNIGVSAKMAHKWMRKLVGPLGKSNCALVLINQVRKGLDMFTPEYTPGGTAIEYAASLRIRLSTSNKADRVEKAGVAVGHKVTFELTKSKICPPHQVGKFTLNY